MRLTNDAKDMIEEIKGVGAEVRNGFVTLYHRTDANGAEAIKKLKYFVGLEDGIFFSTSEKGQAEGYGDQIIKVKIHANYLQLDDVFDKEAHVRVVLKRAGQKFYNFKVIK